jgi:UDP-N-acetylmuramoylalanine--D-glutamate ligase
VEAEELPDVPRAVTRAFERATEGQAILFSPACASFDAYLNFEQRALHFRSCLPPVDAPQPCAIER